MLRRTATRRACLVGLIVLALGAGVASASSGRAAGSAGCVATSLKYTSAGRSTTKYSVAAFGVSCSYAKAWVQRLVPKRPVRKVVAGQVVGGVTGPAGWTCNAWNPPTGTGVPKHAYAGACAPTTPARKKIAWQPML